MAKIIIKLDDEDVDKILLNISEAYGWTATVSNQKTVDGAITFVQEPNPVSAEDYAIKVINSFILDTYKRVEADKTGKAAAELKLTELNSKSITVTKEK